MSIISKEDIKTNISAIDHFIENKKLLTREYKFFFDKVVSESNFKKVFSGCIKESISVYEKNSEGDYQEVELKKTYHSLSIENERYDKFDVNIKVLYSSENTDDLIELGIELPDIIKVNKNYKVCLDVNSLFDKSIMTMWICYVSLLNCIKDLTCIYGDND